LFTFWLSVPACTVFAGARFFTFVAFVRFVGLALDVVVLALRSATVFFARVGVRLSELRAERPRPADVERELDGMSRG
jgi:hypothetical protein